MAELSFAQLANLYGTDKGEVSHCYSHYYDTLFAPFRESARKILEIGVFKWRSLYTLQGYFKSALIIGFDRRRYEETCKDRMIVYRGGQQKRKDLRRLVKECGGDFDFIIEDGGHYMHQQQISLAFLFPYVKPGGFYIIEDVHSSLDRRFIKAGTKSRFYKEDETTTLQMCEDFIRSGQLNSVYFKDEERQYLVDNIDHISLVRINVRHPSILAVIKKGEE